MLILRDPYKGKIPKSDVALKQQHRTAEMTTNDTKMGWNCENNMASSSIWEMTGCEIQTRDVCKPL